MMSMLFASDTSISISISLDSVFNSVISDRTSPADRSLFMGS